MENEAESWKTAWPSIQKVGAFGPLSSEGIARIYRWRLEVSVGLISSGRSRWYSRRSSRRISRRGVWDPTYLSTRLNKRFSRAIVPGELFAAFQAKYNSETRSIGNRLRSSDRTFRSSAISRFSRRNRNLNANASAGSAVPVDCWCWRLRSSRQLKQMCGDLGSQRRPRGNLVRFPYFMRAFCYRTSARSNAHDSPEVPGAPVIYRATTALGLRHCSWLSLDTSRVPRNSRSKSYDKMLRQQNLREMEEW
jgi:hypothetical protein